MMDLEFLFLGGEGSGAFICHRVAGNRKKDDWSTHLFLDDSLNSMRKEVVKSHSPTSEDTRVDDCKAAA
jgi:hypothetical protein